jgi:hypothetical protein
VKILFGQSGDFAASNAAEAWCEANGYAVGQAERGAPRAIKHGEWLVSKWRNLSAAQQLDVDGLMTGDMRHGPVTVEIFDTAPHAATPAQPAEGAAA